MKKIINSVLKPFGYVMYKKADLKRMPFIKNKRAMRFLYFSKIFMATKDVNGHIVECGVSIGRGLLMWFFLMNHTKKTRRIYGFDTFYGLPENSPEDTLVTDHRVGTIAYSQDDVMQFLLASGLPEDLILKHTTLVEGNIKQTAKEYNEGPISILHLDMDFFEGYKCGLESLYPHVSKGGIIMFDEYKSEVEKWPGPVKAIEGFFGQRVNDFQYDEATAKYFYIKPD